MLKLVHMFQRYIGIDYSGAETPDSSLRGLRVYVSRQSSAPQEVLPVNGPAKYWSRRGIAEWLALALETEEPTLVGIDHCFSFPIAYFDTYSLPHNWEFFLEDFRQHWPTDAPHTYVDFIRDGVCGKGDLRCGNSKWRRIAEIRCRAKSAFHFDVIGSVAKSTHSGLPWLLFLKKRFGERLHFWPFDGWQVAPGRSAVVEAYPALCSKSFSVEGRDSHQHDAYSIAAWMQQSDANGSLADYFAPKLDDGEKEIAEIEGWVFGVM